VTAMIFADDVTLWLLIQRLENDDSLIELCNCFAVSAK